MKVTDAIAEVLKREGTEYLFNYPVNPLIEAAAAVGIRPIVCRQERVGLGIADAYARINNGKKTAVFVMQAGPGVENAFPGITTAFSDSSPVLLLPGGYATGYASWPKVFNGADQAASVTKWSERVTNPNEVPSAIRRAFSRLKSGKLGPVMLEVAGDIGREEIDEALLDAEPVRSVRSAADPVDVERAAKALVNAKSPVIQAGQGILYAGATDELVELAELLEAPVYTTILGKSGFPETHPLALGTGHGTAFPRTVPHFIKKADVMFGAGTSFSRHAMKFPMVPGAPPIAGKTLVQLTNDEQDINKHYRIDYPVVGDAKLVLRQMIDAVRDLGGRKGGNGEVREEIKQVYAEWIADWMPKLGDNSAPINPYRVVWELNKTIAPDDAIVTHDAGSPRDEMVPFYRSAGPRSYLGWGNSHALGTGLGFAMGAKLAAPDKVCINFMGDAAIGMVGMDFETAVRERIPIITIVSKNSEMAIETDRLKISHELYNTRDVGGDYADLARALGGRGERVEDPNDLGPAIQRARRITEEEGMPVLLEVITSAEHTYSNAIPGD